MSPPLVDAVLDQRTTGAARYIRVSRGRRHELICSGPMSSGALLRLPVMTEAQTTPTSVSNIGVAMFSVSDQDKAIEFYTQKLGYEVRSYMAFGENGEAQRPRHIQDRR